jgi:formate dehydrogenase maturation protein FdhE
MSQVRTTNAPCPTCGSDEIFILSMTVAESGLRFTCCATCENRWWEREGSSIPLGSVLGIVATR